MPKEAPSSPSRIRSLMSVTGKKLADLSGGAAGSSPLILANARIDFDACLQAVVRAQDALRRGEDALLSAREGARGLSKVRSGSLGAVVGALESFRQALTQVARRFADVKTAIDALGTLQGAPGYVCARLPLFLVEEFDFFSASMYVDLASVLVRQEWLLDNGQPDGEALDAFVNLVETTLLTVRSFNDGLDRHQAHLSLRADFFTYLGELADAGTLASSGVSSCAAADTSVDLPPGHPALRLFQTLAT